MSNRYFSYSFQIHRTRKTIVIFIVFVVLLVGGFFAFYKSKKHMEKLDKLNYEVVLGMNKFEDINCDKAYRLNYKESTCGTICINSKKSDKDYLNKRKSDLEKSGFTTGKIKEKVINKNNWSYLKTVKSNPSISYYAIDYGNKVYSIELIDQSNYLTNTKQDKCSQTFNKMLNSIKLQ